MSIGYTCNNEFFRFFSAVLPSWSYIVGIIRSVFAVVLNKLPQESLHHSAPHSSIF